MELAVFETTKLTVLFRIALKRVDVIVISTKRILPIIQHQCRCSHYKRTVDSHHARRPISLRPERGRAPKKYCPPPPDSPGVGDAYRVVRLANSHVSRRPCLRKTRGRFHAGLGMREKAYGPANGGRVTGRTATAGPVSGFTAGWPGNGIGRLKAAAASVHHGDRLLPAGAARACTETNMQHTHTNNGTGKTTRRKRQEGRAHVCVCVCVR